MDRKRTKEILPYLSGEIRSAVEKLDNSTDIQEIRLRWGRVPTARIKTCEILLDAPEVTQSDIDFSFKAVCEYSLHSFARQLSQGFVTVSGGHRVGFCGTAVVRENSVETVKYISGMNFRIASERFGSADKLMNDIFSRSDCGILIAGAVSSGKTTVLRDLCRQLGNQNPISLIDERGEIAAVYHGIPQNDVGKYTDVFDGYPKSDGIETALRVMTPKYIAIDEIGSLSDVKAVENCINSGTYIIASAHAGSIDEALSRKHLSELISLGAFRKIVFLGSGSEVGKIISVREV